MDKPCFQMKNSIETDAWKGGEFQIHTRKVMGRTNYIVFSVTVLEQNRAKLIEQGFEPTKK